MAMKIVTQRRRCGTPATYAWRLPWSRVLRCIYGHTSTHT